MSEPNFDWKGESGDKFAMANPSSVEGTDRRFIDYSGYSVTELFKQVCQVLEEKGKSFCSHKNIELQIIY
jgi:hypothetical protein